MAQKALEKNRINWKRGSCQHEAGALRIKTYRLAEITVDLTAENMELGKCQHCRRGRVRIDAYIVSGGAV